MLFRSFDEKGEVTLTLGTQAFFWLHVGGPDTATTDDQAAVSAQG